MIAKAVKEEHSRPRPVHITVEHFFKGYPGFSMLLPKIGAVPAHPANVHRLLYDERQLVLVFPEGRKGTEKLYKDRYRLRRFGRGGFVAAAMRAGVPIVPVCVIGAEEAAPIFAQVRVLQRLTGLLYFPITPTFPHLGLAGMLGYLPAKFAIRFLDPIPTDRWGPEPWRDSSLVQTVAQDVRARHPGEPARDALATLERLVRIAGMDSRRILVTGLSTFWGGRLAQALEADPDVETVIGVDARDPTVELERTEYVRVGHPARADPPDRHGRGRDRHGDRHAAHGGLDRRLGARRAREQRDRDDEHPGRVLGPGLAGPQGDRQVLGPLLRLRARRPGLLHRGHAPPAPAGHADRARHRRGRVGGRGLRRQRTPT